MERNDVSAEPAHRWMSPAGDWGTEHAGRRGLQSHELRYTLAAAWSCQGGTETELLRLAGWAVLCQMAATVVVGCLHQPAGRGGTAQPPQLADLP
jgi:hypothetical protein